MSDNAKSDNLLVEKGMIPKLHSTRSYCDDTGHNRVVFGVKRLKMQAEQRHLLALSISANNHCVLLTKRR